MLNVCVKMGKFNDLLCAKRSNVKLPSWITLTRSTCHLLLLSRNYFFFFNTEDFCVKDEMKESIVRPLLMDHLSVCESHSILTVD